MSLEREIAEIKCPWPEDVWTMTNDDYVKAIPDEKMRTAISGFLMRKGWEIAKTDILDKLPKLEIDCPGNVYATHCKDRPKDNPCLDCNGTEKILLPIHEAIDKTGKVVL